MASRKTVEIDEDIYEELQDIAEPLVDDINSVLEKLIAAWKTQADNAQLPVNSYWISARGERLRIGMKLRATYKNKEFWAEVKRDGIEFGGETYGSPSKAAIAVKRRAGAKGAAASQNGWRFWEYYEHAFKAWFPIETLRKNQMKLSA